VVFCCNCQYHKMISRRKIASKIQNQTGICSVRPPVYFCCHIHFLPVSVFFFFFYFFFIYFFFYAYVCQRLFFVVVCFGPARLPRLCSLCLQFFVFLMLLIYSRDSFFESFFYFYLFISSFTRIYSFIFFVAKTKLDCPWLQKKNKKKSCFALVKATTTMRLFH
jgi:hypothetical protein